MPRPHQKLALPPPIDTWRHRRWRYPVIRHWWLSHAACQNQTRRHTVRSSPLTVGELRRVERCAYKVASAITATWGVVTAVHGQEAVRGALRTGRAVPAAPCQSGITLIAAALAIAIAGSGSGWYTYAAAAWPTSPAPGPPAPVVVVDFEEAATRDTHWVHRVNLRAPQTSRMPESPR